MAPISPRARAEVLIVAHRPCISGLSLPLWHHLFLPFSCPATGLLTLSPSHQACCVLGPLLWVFLCLECRSPRWSHDSLPPHLQSRSGDLYLCLNILHYTSSALTPSLFLSVGLMAGVHSLGFLTFAPDTKMKLPGIWDGGRWLTMWELWPWVSFLKSFEAEPVAKNPMRQVQERWELGTRAEPGLGQVQGRDHQWGHWPGCQARAVGPQADGKSLDLWGLTAD